MHAKAAEVMHSFQTAVVYSVNERLSLEYTFDQVRSVKRMIN